MRVPALPILGALALTITFTPGNTAILAAHQAAAGPGQPAAGQAKRPITETDLFAFNWIADPQVSPDGSRVVFTRVVVDEKRTGYETSVWMVLASAGEEPIRLTNGRQDSRARWSPDGRRLVFVRGGEKGDDGKPRAAQLAILSLAGGEAWPLTTLPRGASNPVWSPDGSRIVFSSSTTREDLEKAARTRTAAGPASDAREEHESDVHLVTRAVYRSNDQGFLDPARRQHLWVTSVPAAPPAQPVMPLQLTSGRFDERDPRWSPDGSAIYFVTNRVDEPYYETPSSDICSVPAGGGDVRKLATIPMQVRDLAISPDGRLAAFHGAVTQPVRSYSQPDTWILDLLAPGGQPRNLTAAYDYDVGDSVGGDNAAPRGGSGRTLHWSPDGKTLVDVSSRQGRTALVRIDAQSGEVRAITRGDQAVLDFSLTVDGRTLVALVSSPVVVGDLFAIAPDGAQRRLTNVNGALWARLEITAPEELTYTSFDGKPIQAWIQKPPDFDPAKKYPLILNIHGGPHSAYGWVFDHEFQWMAARGYVVLYVNPRGSTSYGQEFGNIIQYRYPGDDYRDLMAGVDEAVKRGYIDLKKLGVTGGSGGGVLTNWTVTQTGRFAAAVSQRDISNWACWWYTADFSMFQPSWFKAPPFQDAQDYANRSAITFVEKIRTPMMFVLGEADSRTPPECGGEELFRALKFLKRPTAMVLFPRETHELSRSGEPWHRIERLRHIVGWFDKWMLGVAHPEYDVAPTRQVAPAEKGNEAR